MYYLLFNAVTDALRPLDKGDLASAQVRLRRAQQQAEEIFMAVADTLS